MIGASVRLLLAAMVAGLAAPSPAAAPAVAVEPTLCAGRCPGPAAAIELSLDRTVRVELACVTAQAVWAAPSRLRLPSRRAPVTTIAWAAPARAPALPAVLDAAPKTSPPTTTAC